MIIRRPETGKARIQNLRESGDGRRPDQAKHGFETNIGETTGDQRPTKREFGNKLGKTTGKPRETKGR